MEPSNGSPTDELIGQQIRNYRVEELLGSGGMGRIFRAQHLTLKRPVAIKLIHAHMAQNAQSVTRFQREARALSQLNHPHIVKVYDFDEHAHLAYLVMELVDGGTLRDYLSSSVQPALSLSLELICQAADALNYTHSQGIVHRDIKPENLFLTIDPQSQAMLLKIGDFGLAYTSETIALTMAGTMMGTVAYMAPEQATGQPVDGRADIYALGIILYELCAGVTPFSPTTPAEAIFCHVFREPPALSTLRSDIPDELAAIIERCLAKDPAARYQTAAELAVALRAFLATNLLAAPVGSQLQQAPDLVSTLFAGAEIHDTRLVEQRVSDAPALREAQQSIEACQLVSPRNRLHQPDDQDTSASPRPTKAALVIDQVRLDLVAVTHQPIGAGPSVQMEAYKKAGMEVHTSITDTPTAHESQDGSIRPIPGAWASHYVGKSYTRFWHASPRHIADITGRLFTPFEQCNGTRPAWHARPLPAPRAAQYGGIR